MNLIIRIYRKLLVRKSMYSFNKLLFSLSLRGLGILNYENFKVSGEEWLANNLNEIFKTGHIILFDIGANEGDYARMIKSAIPPAKIYSFEPHPVTFLKLNDAAQKYDFYAFNSGCGETDGKIKLYDYKNMSSSQHASIYQGAFDIIHKADFIEYEIEVFKIDNFCKENNIQHINFIKIDAEGHELMVLKGANELIKNNAIDMIQVELSQINLISRTFFKDIVDILGNYTFYRLLPDGLIPLGDYDPVFHELFAFQNIVAVRNDFNIANNR